MRFDYRRPVHCLASEIATALWDCEAPVKILFRGEDTVVVRFKDARKAADWAREWREMYDHSEEPGG